ncbi:MAG: hypothetical protein H7X95_01515 [Deltaproteobacteria bacterium]|nr:hypothetical protein [Deltaproteobacteria bacterium]
MLTKFLRMGLVVVAVSGMGAQIVGATEAGKPADKGVEKTTDKADKADTAKSPGAGAATAAASETTLKGEMTCAKCGLHESSKCQNVLRVKDAAGAESKYYLKKNAVSEKQHEKVCSGSAPATVTGKVTEAKGKKVLAATSVTFD